MIPFSYLFRSQGQSRAHAEAACSSIDLERGRVHQPLIEDYCWGYPQFSALVSSVDSYFIFRRFKRLRARILLLKQDRICALEHQLDAIDKEDPHSIFLGRLRGEGDAKRKDILDEIANCLTDYDQFMGATKQAISYEDPEPIDSRSLMNWLNNNGSIARDEAAYLHNYRDLLTLAPPTDNAVFRFERWVESTLNRYEWFRQLPSHNLSSSPEVFIYTGSMIKRISSGILISLITILLLLPIVICNVVTDVALRITIVMIATVIYLLVLSNLTKAKTTELVIAATTYATVLIVFVSGTGE